MYLPQQVNIREVGPRDGLQLESKIPSTDEKISLLKYLAGAGLKSIEATSFVNPRVVPQHGDAEAVISGLEFEETVGISALVANLKGLKRAERAGIGQINVVISASEVHNLKNVNMTIAQSLAQVKEICRKKGHIQVRGSVSMVFGCPYQGEISRETLTEIIGDLVDYGLNDIALCDTAGLANPKQVYRMAKDILKTFPDTQFAIHLHDTRGMGLANALAALQAGITLFESSLGGLGGCPFIPGASGNVPTEDLLYMFDEMDVSTGINFDRLIFAGHWLEERLDKKLPSRMLRENVCRFREE